MATVLSENVIVHETAHQWWGDLLSWKSYRDQWLFEALANYSALLLLESENPPQFRMVMEKYRQDLLAKNKEGSPLADAGPVTFGTRLNCSHFPDGYNAISYGRGTWLFHMIAEHAARCRAEPQWARRKPVRLPGGRTFYACVEQGAGALSGTSHQ